LLGLSSETGFYFRGSSTLEINVPIHRSLGPIELQSLTIGIGNSNEGIPVNLGASIKAELGPLTAVVENMGITASFTFPDNREGNLGPLDVKLGFKPPKGIGLAIDAGGFKGGGFLSFDTENERYAGILQLEFNSIALKAIGLLTTRLPGGQSGYSLLIIISAEFNPIQLSMGFTLNGAGGLLGLNRTMKIEPLRLGVKNDTLDNIMFPTDPVANTNRIISDLRQIFPPQEGRFVFGPMAMIGWGTPTLITLELGLIIEIPNPVRLAILGVLKAIIPNKEENSEADEENKAKKEILKIQVNFLGFIDFGKKQLSFDASLFESRLLIFTLMGDMAVRLYWGENSNMLLTVGGFHPAFNPPPLNLPSLMRLTLQLTSGNNPRIRIETYFAVTSNTVQFGAQAEFYAASGSLNVYGFLGFDVLFQFSPFHFVAQIRAGLAFRRRTSTIMGVRVSVRLAGPTPWKAKGSVTIKILFVKLRVRFNAEWGDILDVILPGINDFLY